MIIPSTGNPGSLIDASDPPHTKRISLEKYRKEAYAIAEQMRYSKDVKRRILEAHSNIQIEMILLAAAKNLKGE